MEAPFDIEFGAPVNYITFSEGTCSDSDESIQVVEVAQAAEKASQDEMLLDGSNEEMEPSKDTLPLSADVQTSDTVTTIESLPIKILVRIIDNLDRTNALAFGLTAPDLYAAFQIVYGFQSLTYGCEIYYLVANFLGPTYRLVHFSEYGFQDRIGRQIFLKKSVYPEGPTKAETMMRQRYRMCRKVNEKHSAVKVGLELPYPFGMGTDWYAEAEKVVRGEIWDFIEYNARSSSSWQRLREEILAGIYEGKKYYGLR